jgi:hypothetical protein
VPEALTQQELEAAHCWFVDQSTLDSVTVEALVDGGVLPAQTSTALRDRYLPDTLR